VFGSERSGSSPVSHARRGVFVINLSGQGTKIVVDTTCRRERRRLPRPGLQPTTNGVNASFVLGLRPVRARASWSSRRRSVESMYAVALVFVVVGVWYAYRGR
jgi:hypothetical protein